MLQKNACACKYMDPTQKKKLPCPHTQYNGCLAKQEVNAEYVGSPGIKSYYNGLDWRTSSEWLGLAVMIRLQLSLLGVITGAR